jgi:hypothetical protein
MPIIKAIDIPENSRFRRYSDPQTAQRKAHKYLGRNATLYKSTKQGKKYMIKDSNDKWIHFGALGYEDYTKHKDKERRANYLTRSGSIKGNWKLNRYSPNNLSREII